jgi:Mg-chelatase subunit ChlD
MARASAWLIAVLSAGFGCTAAPDSLVSNALPAAPSPATPVDEAGPPFEAPFDAGKPIVGSVPLNDNCGQQSFRTREVVPDMMIVLDRSASMQSRGIDRWTPVVSAIKSLTATFDHGISFGLLLFPGLETSCTPGAVKVPVAAGNAALVERALVSTAPFGFTPTGESLHNALLAFRASAAARAQGSPAPPRYVLLVTDGEPSCPSAEGAGGRTAELALDKELTLQEIDALRAEGIDTFVLGCDAGMDARLASALAEFALHGGTGSYYDVRDEKTLLAAFNNIAQAVINCSFQLDTRVLDPALVHVSLDQAALPQDDPNGWTLSGQTVTVHGAACTKLQEEQNQQIDITLDCVPTMLL